MLFFFQSPPHLLLLRHICSQMSLSNHFHIPSLSISIAVNGFIFCLSFLINIIPLWCDKMPQMNRATLICISFYFHSANCDDSTVSFIIKFNCGEKRYIDTVCCCLASAFICVCVYMCTLLLFFSFSFFLANYTYCTCYHRYNVQIITNYKQSAFNFALLHTYMHL